MWEQPLVMPQQNSPEKAIQLVWQLATPELAKERPLQDPGSPRTELLVAWRSDDRSPVLRDFIELVRRLAVRWRRKGRLHFDSK